MLNDPVSEEATIDDGVVYLVDNDAAYQREVTDLLSSVRVPTIVCDTADSFLQSFEPDRPSCTLLEARLPQTSGLEVLSRIRAMRATAPVSLLSRHATVAMAVRAMQLGAAHVFEKPANHDLVLAALQQCLEADHVTRRAEIRCAEVRRRLATLSPRERQVMALVLDGLSNKESARKLGISPKAIEVHRANMMRKMAVKSAVLLAQMVCDCAKTIPGPASCAGRGHAASPATADDMPAPSIAMVAGKASVSHWGIP